VLRARLAHGIKALRDGELNARERAVIGSFMAAQIQSESEPQQIDERASRTEEFYGYGRRHESASAWDGRSVHSGTITYVDEEWIEQHVGQQRWIIYEAATFEHWPLAIGDQVRFVKRNGSCEAEAIGANRLHAASAALSRPTDPLHSGMTVFLASEIDASEIEAIATSVDDRHGASLAIEGQAWTLEFPGEARLGIMRVAASTGSAAGVAARLVPKPLVDALHLKVTVRPDKPDGVFAAERALVLCAAAFTAGDAAVACDDTGAIFFPEQLYALGARAATRADAFAFRAAAARQLSALSDSEPSRTDLPPSSTGTSSKRRVSESFAIFSTRAESADLVRAEFSRAVETLADAADTTEDVVAAFGRTLFPAGDQVEPGALQPLAQLAFQTVEIDIAFLDANTGDARRWPLLQAREDVRCLLGMPIRTIVVFEFGNRTSDIESALFWLEMRRADVVTTALAAILARRGHTLAADAGSIYPVEELVELALQRRGRTASLAALVAAARDG
jgi:hypothetical protein